MVVTSAVFGKEGTAAVQNADFAIPQFWHITRLLLVHGRCCYLRISKLVGQWTRMGWLLLVMFCVGALLLFQEYGGDSASVVVWYGEWLQRSDAFR